MHVITSILKSFYEYMRFKRSLSNSSSMIKSAVRSEISVLSRFKFLATYEVSISKNHSYQKYLEH